MDDNSSTSRRLAKNTLFLYARSFFSILVSLYTSRVLLQALGVEDFGVYNVVGGVVSFLGILNASMSGASSRFVSFAIGKEDSEELHNVFSTVKLIHICLAVVVLLLAETVGLWFVLEKLVIPGNRMTAAFWCYQCSILTTLVSIVSIPYNSLVIGHEKMDVFAYISIFEVLLRLAFVLLLLVLPFDKLITYSALMLIVYVSERVIYTIYCKKKFEETKVGLKWNSELFKEIFSFAGWTFNGQLACIGYTQGINILLNLYFGPAVNAARGVAVQVQNAAKILVNNFQIALRPQMIKAWAQERVDYMHTLVVYSSKFSFFLTALTVFPLVLTIKPILAIWLVEVPEHTANFVTIILYSMLVDSFCHSMIVSIHAVGNIKKFQIWEGTALLTVVPIAWVLLKYFSITPEQVMLVYLFVQFFTQIIRMIIVLPEIRMKWKDYVLKVFPRVLLVLALQIPPVVIFDFSDKTSFFVTAISLLLSFTYCGITIYLVGLTSSERKLVISLFVKYIQAKHKR